MGKKSLKNGFENSVCKKVLVIIYCIVVTETTSFSTENFFKKVNCTKNDPLERNKKRKKEDVLKLFSLFEKGLFKCEMASCPIVWTRAQFLKKSKKIFKYF